MIILMEQTPNLTSNTLLNFFIGMLDRGEWRSLLLVMLLTFSVTYILKIGYNIVVKEEKEESTDHIRMIAILAGFFSAFFAWPSGMLSMPWYVAGMFMGPGSMLIYKILQIVSNSEFILSNFPWIKTILRAKK